ncbi:MAG: DUF1989 domain-containing protein [Litorimonas sp.]
MTNFDRISPRSGAAVTLLKGDVLTVRDPEGQQVSDLIAYNQGDLKEYLSSGRTIDYASRLFLTTGDILYSNRSNPMLTIIHDDVGRHDFTLTPCSRAMFEKLYPDEDPHRGCLGNLAAAVEPLGLTSDDVPIAFNIFMHVSVNSETGEIAVLPPLSKPGDVMRLRAEMDLEVALTACSAGQSNNFIYKPIEYHIQHHSNPSE